MKKDDAKPEKPYKPTMFESARETIDSIAIAFILAFLFRTFEAEAFYIPTGSMALTLMGAHKELPCPECGMVYRTSASSENSEDPKQRPRMVSASMCPNCRFKEVYGKTPPPTYNGDRILVTKYSYDSQEPQRYDVAVFKNPSLASQNYIKRLVGLPKEAVLIYRGDIYSKPDGEEKYTIRRKPPEKVVSVMQRVYDNDFVLKKIIDRGWPQRWRPSITETVSPEATWKTSEDLRSFNTNGKSTDVAWLRYRHIVPNSRDWAKLLNGGIDPGDALPQLISDYCEFNANSTDKDAHIDLMSLGVHWVSDLILECELQFGQRDGDDAEAVLELVEGGRAFQARIRAATGDVELRIEGVDNFRATAKAAVVGAGPHKLRFANVDDQLVFWVNDKPVAFDGPTTFLATNVAQVFNNRLHAGDAPERVALDGDTQLPVLDLDVPKQRDLESPAGIGAHGVAVDVKHLRILRDVYYVANGNDNGAAFDPLGNTNEQVTSDYYEDVFAPFRQVSRTNTDDAISLFMSDVSIDPSRWRKVRGVTFKMDADQFFMLGDNSPHSLDGRLWLHEHFVKRELLIGKALFVYWPHGFSEIGNTGIHLPSLPFIGNTYWPNFGAMRLIR